MKVKAFKKIFAATIAVSTLFTLAPVKASAAWYKDGSGSWSYIDAYGYATGWKQVGGIWYYFNSFGQMMTGWVFNDNEWYYMDLSGAMQTGVIQIEGKTYLFSTSGAMQKGSNIIGTKLYNFDDNGVCMGPEYPSTNKAFDYYGNDTIPYIPSQVVIGNENMSTDIPSNSANPTKQYKVIFKDPDVDDKNDQILKTRTVPEDTNMPLYKPTKTGYDFVEWNTKSNGNGTSYEYDDSIKITTDITLYAVWEESTNDNTDTSVKVTKIDVNGSNNIAAITKQGGSLQMTKIISPNDADNQTVTWSVINGAKNSSGRASISTTGYLTAIANGTVTVRATANDGSKVYGEVDILISGQ